MCAVRKAWALAWPPGPPLQPLPGIDGGMPGRSISVAAAVSFFFQGKSMAAGPSGPVRRLALRAGRELRYRHVPFPFGNLPLADNGQGGGKPGRAGSGRSDGMGPLTRCRHVGKRRGLWKASRVPDWRDFRMKRCFVSGFHCAGKSGFAGYGRVFTDRPGWLAVLTGFPVLHHDVAAAAVFLRRQSAYRNSTSRGKAYPAV